MNNPTYNPHTRRWHHARQPNLGFRLLPAFDSEIVVKHSMVLDDPAVFAIRGNTRQWWNRSLAHDAPEMAPAMEWIDNYLEESRLLAANVSFSDPAIGRLLAFGWTADYKHQNRHPEAHKIVAFAGGRTGSDLVVARMHNEKRRLEGFDGDGNERLLVPHFAIGSEFRHRFHSPIRQICFARNPYRGESIESFFAVRLSTYTKICRVRHLPWELPDQHFSLQTLATHRPGKAPADVTFNPWLAKQFGTIDQRGDWQVFDLRHSYEDSRRDSGSSLQHVALGHLATDSESMGVGGRWGKICWGGDTNTIMTCNRHVAAIFDIRTSTAAPSINLPADSDRSWILDLQIESAGLAKRHDVFVLTSSHITQVDPRQPGRALLSWAHGRHRDDISMYLDLFCSKDVTTALISSRINTLTTCHQFSPSHENNNNSTMLGDPFILPPPFAAAHTHSSSDNKSRSKSATTMTILPCSFRRNGGQSVANDQEVNFFVGFSIDRELEISRRIYTASPAQDEGGGNHGPRLAYQAPVVIADSDVEDEDDVLQPPQDGSVIFQRINLAEFYEHAFQELHPPRRRKEEGGDDETNSIESYCTRLNEVLVDRVDRGNIGISTLIETCTPSGIFDKPSTLQREIQTLLPSPPPPPPPSISLPIPDLNAARNGSHYCDTHETKCLIPRISPTSLLATPPQSSPASPASPLSEVQVLYENLVRTRVTPLPEIVPGRVRLRRERLCRLIATEVFLASVGVNVKPTPEQLLPPPLPPVASAATTANPKNSSGGTEEPLQRIRAYAHIQTRISLPQELANVLASWKLGEDPEEFEFFVDPEEGVPRYRRDRRKVRKERLRQLATGTGTGTGGAADISGVSQPLQLGDGGGGPAASTQLQGQSHGQGQSQGDFAVVMSQVERGKHGGRKQKKRKTGF